MFALRLEEHADGMHRVSQAEQFLRRQGPHTVALSVGQKLPRASCVDLRIEACEMWRQA